MKIYILAIILCIIGIRYSNSQSSVLEKKINLQLKNNTASDIFKKITEKTNYYFTYNSEIINQNKYLTYNFKNVSIKEILDISLSDTSLIYKVVDNHIVICKNRKQFKPADYQETKIKINGKISEADTKKNLPFVSVGILNSTIGTVTNESGNFTLQIDSVYIDSTLYVIHLGYKSVKIPVREASEKEINNIILQAEYLPIQEVIIRINDPIFLLKKALEHTQNNYFQKPTVLSAFYREGVYKKETILNFSEALITIYKSPYKSSLITDKIKIEKSRKIRNVEKSDSLIIKLKDGLYSGLELDIIKNPVDFLNSENLQYYKYHLTDLTVYDGKLVYAIDFEQIGGLEDALFKGRFYIETETFAIIAAEFELNLKEGNKRPEFVVKKNKKYSVEPISAKYSINYRPVNKKYILNHVRADLEMKIKRKKELFPTKYRTFFETVIFDIDTIRTEKFESEEVVKKNLVFVDYQYIYDSEFWGNENFIKPDESLKEALKRLKVKLILSE
jgi:hypothetical protein